MKKILIFILLFFSSCEHVELSPPVQEWEIMPIENNWVMYNSVIDIINEHRLSIEMDTLVRDPKLTTYLAVQHCNYMILKGRISHDGFSNRAEILSNNGAKSVGENVAFGYNTSSGVVNAWLNSSSHREIIEGDYNGVGLGIRENEYGDKFYCLIMIRK